MAGSIHYAAIKMDEAFYEDVIIERLCDEHGYTHLYGPDVERTSDKYDDVFLPGVLAAALKRINPNLPRQAIQEALLKLNDVGSGSLAQRNEAFNDYLQTGVEVRFFDGKEERDDIVYLLDFDDPENNDFHVVNQWTFVEYSEKRPDVIAFVNGMPLGFMEAKRQNNKDGIRAERDRMVVRFKKKIRPEMKFSSLKELSLQLEADREYCLSEE